MLLRRYLVNSRTHGTKCATTDVERQVKAFPDRSERSEQSDCFTIDQIDVSTVANDWNDSLPT